MNYTVTITAHENGLTVEQIVQRVRERLPEANVEVLPNDTVEVIFKDVNPGILGVIARRIIFEERNYDPIIDIMKHSIDNGDCDITTRYHVTTYRGANA